MSDNNLFKNKYRIDSHRLKGWDYSWPGLYYITICTKDRANYFGEIKNNKMVINQIGKIIKRNWSDIPKHIDNIVLHEFVIMPNHLHGILEIEDDDKSNVPPVETLHATSLPGDKLNVRNQLHATSLPENQNKNINRNFSEISAKFHSISTIIRSFKSACTNHINKSFPEQNFAWQPGFYDVIIKDDKSLEKIQNYIIENPTNWDQDEENTIKIDANFDNEIGK